jgi:hypothetical protein
MNPWALVLLLIALLVGATVATYLWAHQNYTVGVDFNFKAIALAISAAAIAVAAGMFIWKLFRRRK